MLRAEGLDFSYMQGKSSLQAIKDINLEIPDHTTCAIIGPSGCGKTTLLYILSGLLKPDRGRVLINGRTPVADSKDIAIILQDYGLLPWKTVKDNVELGLKFRGLRACEYEKRVKDMLRELNIERLMNKYPSQLSGGQRQRVAIARALTLNPEVLFMDEPFSSLDALTRENVQNLFLKLWNKYMFTAVFVTHSIEEAVFLGQKIVILSPGPGRILAEIDNSHFASENWRESKSFFAQCQRVRSSLKAWDRNEE